MNNVFDFKSINSIIKGRIPNQAVIQISNYCNALCPQCGMRKTNHIERKMLSTEYIKKIIDKAAENNFQAISFTGGEPMLHYKELIELLKYSTEKNIKYIRTGTNGFIFMESDSPKFIDKVKKIAEDISNTNLRNFWISVDSADIV